MIRQLPKLSLPSYFKQGQADVDSLEELPEVKIYDIITESTPLNSEGNTMQLQLYQRDSDTNEGQRELHGRLVLTTKSMPDEQDLKFGFMFAEDAQNGVYDGLQVRIRRNAANQTPSFRPMDITSTQRPNVFADKATFEQDKSHDWVILEEESSVACENVGQCEYSVVFMRNFQTGDEVHDIAIEKGEERSYALTGFYQAHAQSDQRLTHIGQSQEMFILMGASNFAASSLLAAASLIAFCSF